VQDEKITRRVLGHAAEPSSAEMRTDPDADRGETIIFVLAVPTAALDAETEHALFAGYANGSYADLYRLQAAAYRS